jgi:uncharacterized protein YeaO (DUF488 family)
MGDSSMIYLASYFEPKNHHGQVISISRSIPKNLKFKIDGHMPYLAPSAQLLFAWDTAKKSGTPMPWEVYTAEYRVGFAETLAVFKAWLATLTPDQDITLCCWERAGEHCHRNLVGVAIAKFAPQLWGGADMPKAEPLPLFTGTNPPLEPDQPGGALTCGLESPDKSTKYQVGQSVTAMDSDWVTGEQIPIVGKVTKILKSSAGGMYGVTSDNPKCLFSYFCEGKVKALS